VHLRGRTSEAELDSLFWRVATPGDAEYLRFRSISDLSALVGGSDKAVQETREWLRAINGTNIYVSALRDRVTATFNTTTSAFPRTWSARGLPLQTLQPRSVLLITRRDAASAPAEPQRRATASRPSFGYSIKAQKDAYQMPTALATTNEQTLQMVWGPGTFGYSPAELAEFKDEQCPGLNLEKIAFDTRHHGTPGGDNFGEGSLDIRMIASFGMNASTLVSNTNASLSTEESDGFGLAMLDFVTELASRPTVPHVLSLSLGSLSAFSCQLLCDEAAKTGEVTLAACRQYLEQQRQVCMFMSTEQVSRINTGLMALGLRGVSVFGSSGDGGSHWSFEPFRGFGKIPRVLNKVGCQFNFPIFPSPSPYMVSVGGTEWRNGDSSRPVMWSGSGGGFTWQFGRPKHQDAPVSAYLANTPGLPQPSSFNATGRAYPDISAVAVDGTSQSSPTFAGIFTQVVDARLNAGLPPLGAVAPRIWQVAQAYPGEAFEDVLEGNSKTSCAEGFPAAKGWDPTTGWGRPVWPGLLKHFASDDGIRQR